jgi:hypothetical protein
MPYVRKTASSYRYWRRSKTNPDAVYDGAIAFEPRNELNVREIFAERAARLGYRIIESRTAFPDYILTRDGDRLLVEAEFHTSDFLRHRHDIGRCDMIIVWEHDLPYMPVPVLELKTDRLIKPRRGRTAGLLGR